MKKNIIFLDIDGVLTCRGTRFKHAHPEAAYIMDLLIGSLNAQVVICSAWRKTHTPKQMKEKLRKWGIRPDHHWIHDDFYTPCTGIRLEEILLWCMKNYRNDHQYFWIDDDIDYRFVDVEDIWDLNMDFGEYNSKNSLYRKIRDKITTIECSSHLTLDDVYHLNGNTKNFHPWVGKVYSNVEDLKFIIKQEYEDEIMEIINYDEDIIDKFFSNFIKSDYIFKFLDAVGVKILEYRSIDSNDGLYNKNDMVEITLEYPRKKVRIYIGRFLGENWHHILEHIVTYVIYQPRNPNHAQS